MVENMETAVETGNIESENVTSVPIENNFVDTERASTLLKGFSEIYKNKQFVDITLKVEDSVYPCHKNVLAISSPYFMGMFSNNCVENRSNEVNIQDITPETMELILDYIYTGQVLLSEDTVQQLLSAANLFQLLSLRLGCADFMIKHVSVSNCIGMYFFAKAHECDILANKAKEIINNKFTLLCTEAEFLSLPCDKLIEIVSDNQVLVPAEEKIFESCMAWLKFDFDQRQHSLEQVMSCVRFANISSYYFCDNIDKNTLFSSCQKLRQRLDEVRYYHMLRNRGHEMDLNLTPREGMSYKQAIVIIANPYCEDNQKRYNSMEALLPNTAVLATICKLPLSLYMPGCAITGDNQIYIAGGAIRRINYRGSITTEGISTNVYMIDQTSNVWNTKAKLHVARYQHTLTVLDGFLFAAGGYDGSQIFSSVEKYDPAQNIWSMVAPLPKALHCLSSISFKGKLYVMGGQTSTEIRKSVYSYDRETDQWSNLADMKIPRALTGLVVYHNVIYVIGGNSAMSEKWRKEFLPEHCVSSVEVYNPETNNWKDGPELPNALCGAGVVKYEGTILVVGGEDENSWMAGLFMLQYDSQGRPMWVEGIEIPTVMSTFGCVIANMTNDVFINDM